MEGGERKLRFLTSHKQQLSEVAALKCETEILTGETKQKLWLSNLESNAKKATGLSIASIFLRNRILSRQQGEKWAYYIFQYERGQAHLKSVFRQKTPYWNYYITPVICYYMSDSILNLAIVPAGKEETLSDLLVSNSARSINLSFWTAAFVSRNPQALLTSFLIGLTLFNINSLTCFQVRKFL